MVSISLVLNAIVSPYSDVIMASQITSIWIAQPFVQAHIKENIKSLRHWILLGESTGDPYKGPVMWKMFPFDDVIMLKTMHEIKAAVNCESHITRQALIFKDFSDNVINQVSPQEDGFVQIIFTRAENFF